MPLRWWPQSIRWQMLVSLVLLEALSTGLFAVLLIRHEAREITLHTRQRLAHDAMSMAMQSREALIQQHPDWVGMSVKMMGMSPNVSSAKVTDPAGDILFASEGGPENSTLGPIERAQIPLAPKDKPLVFNLGGDRWESVNAIYTGSDLRGFAWVESSSTWNRQHLDSIRNLTAIFSILWIAASVVLVWLMYRSFSRPLATLRRGASALMNSPGGSGYFPLPVIVHNEMGDLIETFNRMVASLEEQRAGLNDTLSLLDSMLANAPIGLAFFDRQCRFVRVNQFFADLTGVPLSDHLGDTLIGMLPQPAADELESTIRSVLAQGEPVRDLELSGQEGKLKQPWTWLVSVYPVRTNPHEVRWVGVIVLDESEYKRSEEALRKAEKLAITGRLAASIAHEINNPLEAVTNLLFLLGNFCNLEDAALNYVKMAEQEMQRITEITQHTLGLYRRSPLPPRSTLGELLDSVLSSYKRRVSALKLQIEQQFDPATNVYCYAGEVRQILANLVGNAIDASSEGGRLIVRARRSRNWKNPGKMGIRFSVADTGTGMTPAVRERVFEAFFTTKEESGTGLGLWVSQEILSKHDGLMHLRSRTANAGKSSGTVFQIFIPDDPKLAQTTKQSV